VRRRANYPDNGKLPVAVCGGSRELREIGRVGLDESSTSVTPLMGAVIVTITIAVTTTTTTAAPAVETTVRFLSFPWLLLLSLSPSLLSPGGDPGWALRGGNLLGTWTGGGGGGA
jgi:Na+/serine symporter